ncbi:MAG: hypothetical protein ABSG52_05165 [Terriglobales bacterium]|jgi:hypothetical protein
MATTSNKSMEPKQPSFLAGVTRGKILVRWVLTVALVVAALLMAACNSRILGTALQGKYVSGKHSTMNIEIEFKSGNKANFNYGIFGNRSPTTEVDYEVHGKEVTFKNMMKSNNMVAKIADDGCLDFGDSAFGKVCKQVDRTLSGTYFLPKENPMARRGAHWQIEIKPGNKANWNYSSPRLQQQPTVDTTYEIHGEEVTFRFPKGRTRVATITDDGCVDFGDLVLHDGHPSGLTDIQKLCK